MGYYSGNDTAENVLGTYVDDSIYLYGGNDTARGSFGGDWLDGGDGNDLLSGGYQSDNLYGGAGADRLNGDSGSDVIAGGAGRDVMNGGSGDDRFVIDSATEMRGDRVFGGTGIDTLVLNLEETARLTFTARDSLTASVFGGMTFRDIERYEIEGGSQGDRMTGWLLDDDFSGNGGNDRLAGYFGADTLDGGAGNDVLLGGGDDDYLWGSDGNDQGRGGFGNDGLYGGAGNDRLLGEYGSDTIEGGTGRDVLSGGAGDDTLDANGYTNTDTERDTINAGAGSDLVRMGIADVANGQAGVDRLEVDFSESARNETWVLRAAAHTFANGAWVSGFESLSYVGGSRVDAITGGRLSDDLSGGDGNDRLNGGAGNDFLDGDRGNDLVVGGAGNDVLSHSSGSDRLLGQAGADTFNLSWDELTDLPARVSVDGGAGRDTADFLSSTLSAVVDLTNQARNDGLALGTTLRGVEVLQGTTLDDSFAGSGRADTFFGNSGDDVLSGRGGNDRLVGGDGADLLTGGAGADVFDFRDYSSGWRGDTITDFTRGQDHLAFNLDDLGWESDGSVRLISGVHPEAVGNEANLLFDRATGRLWLDADGAGDTHGPELLVTLTGVRALAESDFIFT